VRCIYILTTILGHAGIAWEHMNISYGIC
jgi:hypothetical protein